MELKYCGVLNSNCKKLNGLLSTQQSHLGIVDIGYYSFSYYEITNDKKLLNAKVYTWDELYDIIATHSGQDIEKVRDDSDRDYWMKADEAEKYGMIDEILIREKN